MNSPRVDDGGKTDRRRRGKRPEWAMKNSRVAVAASVHRGAARECRETAPTLFTRACAAGERLPAAIFYRPASMLEADTPDDVEDMLAVLGELR